MIYRAAALVLSGCCVALLYVPNPVQQKAPALDRSDLLNEGRLVFQLQAFVPTKNSCYANGANHALVRA